MAKSYGGSTGSHGGRRDRRPSGRDYNRGNARRRTPGGRGSYYSGGSNRSNNRGSGDFYNLFQDYWIDIIVCSVLLIGLIFIILNFKVVLDALFVYIIYPILSLVLNIIGIVVFVVIIVLYIRYRFSGRRW